MSCFVTLSQKELHRLEAVQMLRRPSADQLVASAGCRRLHWAGLSVVTGVLESAPLLPFPEKLPLPTAMHWDRFPDQYARC